MNAIQRFGGAANSSVLFHALVLDGVYVVPPQSREVRFVALARPSGEEVARVLADTAGRVARALERIGLGPDADNDEAEPLERLSDGRVLYRMRKPWRDGITHLIFEPAEFMARLTALVPPPRAHTIRISRSTRARGCLA